MMLHLMKYCVSNLPHLLSLAVRAAPQATVPRELLCHLQKPKPAVYWSFASYNYL
jgi:hypothetical protein